MRYQKREISNQRNYGQNVNWAGGLKQHGSLLWNFLKRCSVNDSTPLAHSCTALCYHIAHDQFFARGLCEKLIMARWWQRYTARNQRIRAGANATCAYRFCMIIMQLCIKKLSIIEPVIEMNALGTCCGSSYRRRPFAGTAHYLSQTWRAGLTVAVIQII